MYSDCSTCRESPPTPSENFVYCALCEHMPKLVEGIATQLLLLLNCARERNRQHDKPPEHLPPSSRRYSTSFPLAQTLPKSNDSQVKVETRRICNTLRRASQGVESTHTHTHQHGVYLEDTRLKGNRYITKGGKFSFYYGTPGREQLRCTSA